MCSPKPAFSRHFGDLPCARIAITILPSQLLEMDNLYGPILCKLSILLPTLFAFPKSHNSLWRGSLRPDALQTEHASPHPFSPYLRPNTLSPNSMISTEQCKADRTPSNPTLLPFPQASVFPSSRVVPRRFPFAHIISQRSPYSSRRGTKMISTAP